MAAVVVVVTAGGWELGKATVLGMVVGTTSWSSASVESSSVTHSSPESVVTINSGASSVVVVIKDTAGNSVSERTGSMETDGK